MRFGTTGCFLEVISYEAGFDSNPCKAGDVPTRFRILVLVPCEAVSTWLKSQLITPRALRMR